MMTRRSAARICGLIALLFGLQLVSPEPSCSASSCVDNGSQVCYFYLGSPGCDLVLSGGGIELISVRVLSTPITRARFSIPDPPVGTIAEENWNFPHTGDRTNGIELDLGECSQAGEIQLGTLVVVDVPVIVAGCPWWRIDDGAEVDYCTGDTGPGVSYHHVMSTAGVFCEPCASWQWCPSLPPENLFPQNGAIDVPLDVQLTCLEGRLLRITDDPGCVDWQEFPCTGSSFFPDFLQHSTTYYWQVFEDPTGSGCSVGHDTHSAIYSFATVAPLPAEHCTWGAIKSLYQ